MPELELRPVLTGLRKPKPPAIETPVVRTRGCLDTDGVVPVEFYQAVFIQAVQIAAKQYAIVHRVPVSPGLDVRCIQQHLYLAAAQRAAS